MKARKIYAPLLVVFLLGSSFSTPLNATLPVSVDGDKLPSLAPVLERVTPAVVNINTETKIRVQEHPLLSDPFFRRFFDIPSQPRERRDTSLGSGVIVNARKGYVITNNHVIGKADIIHVTLRDGRTLKAKRIGSDPATDVAVLQIPAEKLSEIPLANSDRLQVGDFVVAIGNPFGLGQTVTSGIVSALGRSGLGIEGYEDFIQTDASINPGNSGGALINLRGELIGINTAIYAPNGGNIGIGFAIPINMVQKVMKQLITYGEVHRGRLGAQAQDLNPELAKAFNIPPHTKGAVVVQVTADSPASRAGLQVGDVVTEVNGKPVRSADVLRNTIGLMRVGDAVELVVLRNGQTLSLKTRVAEAKLGKVDGKQLHPKLDGLTVTNITENSPYFGRIQGIQITLVKKGTVAASSGILPGDVITSINRVKISDTQQALHVASASKSQLLLNIRRGNKSLLLMLR